MSKEDTKHCMGLGLGCPSPWVDWEAHGYDPSGKGFGLCFCDKAAGSCGAGTIDTMIKKCCADE